MSNLLERGLQRVLEQRVLVVSNMDAPGFNDCLVHIIVNIKI